jgi:hypothetical protein
MALGLCQIAFDALLQTPRSPPRAPATNRPSDPPCQQQQTKNHPGVHQADLQSFGPEEQKGREGGKPEDAQHPDVEQELEDSFHHGRDSLFDATGA